LELVPKGLKQTKFAALLADSGLSPQKTARLRQKPGAKAENQHHKKMGIIVLCRRTL
jgi:hypothetical protein